MWRSSMSRVAGWPVDRYLKGWTESLVCMLVPDEWGGLEAAEADGSHTRTPIGKSLWQVVVSAGCRSWWRWKAVIGTARN